MMEIKTYFKLNDKYMQCFNVSKRNVSMLLLKQLIGLTYSAQYVNVLEKNTYMC